MTPEQALREAIDHTRFLADHLEGRMGDGALADMRMKADEWEEALGKPSEAEARAERAESQIAALIKQRHAELADASTSRVDMGVRLERAEADARYEKAWKREFKAKLDRAEAENVLLRSRLHMMAEQKKSDEWNESDLHEAGLDEVSSVDDLDWVGGYDSLVDAAREALATPPPEGGPSGVKESLTTEAHEDALAALDRLIVDDYERDEKGNTDERPQDIALIRRYLTASAPMYAVPEDESGPDGEQLYSLHEHPPSGADFFVFYPPASAAPTKGERS